LEFIAPIPGRNATMLPASGRGEQDRCGLCLS
jgi:hypothetical protein